MWRPDLPIGEVRVGALHGWRLLFCVWQWRHRATRVRPNLMLALEDEFDVEFPERLLKRSTFESVLNLREALESLLGTE